MLTFICGSCGTGCAVARAVVRGLMAAALSVAPAGAGPQNGVRPIDVQHSKLTVFVYKGGVLSAFGDDHVISAPISSGTISLATVPAISLVVSAADLVVLDPGLDAEKRAEVRSRMLGPEVLDTMRFPTIKFESTRIESTGSNRWTVAGQLTIRGTTRPITFSAARVSNRYRGEARVRQRDFGIEPIRIAAGTVRVKDELKIEFEIAAAERG
ncbi:MAG: YceI family protein [Vicinamibacterales bacterium]